MVIFGERASLNGWENISVKPALIPTLILYYLTGSKVRNQFSIPQVFILWFRKAIRTKMKF